MKEIIIGKEYDSDVITKLKHVINELGGKIKNKTNGIAGSQELQIFDFVFTNQIVTVEIETYMGIKIIGDETLINEIVNKIKSET